MANRSGTESTVLKVDRSDDIRRFHCYWFSVDNVQHYCAGFDCYYPSLWRQLIVNWLCLIPHLRSVVYYVALKVIHYPELELARFQTNMLQAQIQQQTIPSKASSRFVRALSNSQIWSTLAGNILNTWSAKRNYAMWTDWKLTFNNITRYRWMKGYYPPGFYHLEASLTLRHLGLTSGGAPEWPSTCCQLMIYS